MSSESRTFLLLFLAHLIVTIRKRSPALGQQVQQLSVTVTDPLGQDLTTTLASHCEGGDVKGPASRYCACHLLAIKVGRGNVAHDVAIILRVPESRFQSISWSNSAHIDSLSSNVAIYFQYTWRIRSRAERRGVFVDFTVTASGPRWISRSVSS